MLGRVLVDSHYRPATLLQLCERRIRRSVLRTFRRARPDGEQSCQEEPSAHPSTPCRARRQVFWRCLCKTLRQSICAARRDSARPARERKECCRGTAARSWRRCRVRQALVRAGGTGVISRSVVVASAPSTLTTTAVMLSLPPLTFASWISASTILSGFARESSNC